MRQSTGCLFSCKIGTAIGSETIYYNKRIEVKAVDISKTGTLLAIVVICYLIGIAAKQSKHLKDEGIPVIVGVCGGILGVIGMYVMPDFPASDIMNAIAVGIVSGLASTGVNQAYKQLKSEG